MFGEKSDLQSRTIIIAALIVAGVFLGYVYVNASGKSTSTLVLHMDWKQGVVFDPGDSLGPEDREEIKAHAIEKVFEDEWIGTLLSGEEYSVEATIHGAQAIGEILQNSTLMRSDTRIVLEARPVVTVTITFSDGSGYNVQVEISDWSVGEPVYSDEVEPPALFREAVDRALNRTRGIP
ncbi:MAG: hypothetical protein JSV27_04475 [Candidatus Bathyarchaeota archaeon]|nr:MAG: hypothetical protein JSV27_04475 [Candidatus Bathyarchaeota archaeon]